MNNVESSDIIAFVNNELNLLIIRLFMYMNFYSNLACVMGACKVYTLSLHVFQGERMINISYSSKLVHNHDIILRIVTLY